MVTELTSVSKLSMSKIRSLACIYISDKDLKDVCLREEHLTNDLFMEGFRKLTNSTVIIVDEDDYSILPSYIKQGRKIYTVSERLKSSGRLTVFPTKEELVDSINDELLSISYVVIGTRILGEETLTYCSRIVRVIMGGMTEYENDSEVITCDDLIENYYKKFKNIKIDEHGNELIVEKWSTVFKDASRAKWYDPSENFTYR